MSTLILLEIPKLWKILTLLFDNNILFLCFSKTYHFSTSFK